ncbi:MAG: DUF2062 domain-containing protein [Wenzhouxiangellaceae bacterium]
MSAVLERGGSLNVDEYALARGVAVGLVVGLTPTVGIQTFMMLIASLTFRANFPAAMVVSFVSNPLTMGPLYYGFNQLGAWLMDRLPISHAPVSGLGQGIASETLAMVIGSLVIALPAGLIGYVLFLFFWRKLNLRLPILRLDERKDKSSGSGPGKGGE